MDLEEVRRMALSLPGTTESPHFELTSFRVRGRIYATAPPGGGTLHIFLDEHATRAMVASDPRAFEELHWGKQLAGIRVNLDAAETETVQELLEESWRRRAGPEDRRAHGG